MAAMTQHLGKFPLQIFVGWREKQNSISTFLDVLEFPSWPFLPNNGSEIQFIFSLLNCFFRQVA